MAITAEQKLSNAVIVTKTVKSASAVTKGYPVKYDGSDETTVLNASSNEKAVAIALETGAAGAKVQICMLTGGAICPVLVGTGGATAGEYAIATTNGVTNQTLGGGTNVKYICGRFTQTGVAGDMVGMTTDAFAGVAA